LLDAVEQVSRLHFPQPKPRVCPSDQEITTLSGILNESNKTILAGAGCAGAHTELIEVAGKLKAPIMHALRGKEFVEYDNPFDGQSDSLQERRAERMLYRAARRPEDVKVR
jgi:pyruvate dehydrogenase (quinone)